VMRRLRNFPIACVHVFIYLSIGEGAAENKLVCFSGCVVEVEMDYYMKDAF